MSVNNSQGIFIYGNANMTITVDELNFWYLFNVRYTISAGCQFGALCVMFFVTWIMTNETKRKTPVFILNMLSLGFGMLRILFGMLAELSSYNRFYSWFTFDYSHDTTSERTISILGIIFTWLMLIVINTSLVLNAYTVCKTLSKRYKYPLISVSVFFLFATATWRFTQMVLNIQAVLQKSEWILKYEHSWFRQIGQAFETGSLWWFCCIFSGKLILTQRERTKVGMKIWPATQILSSMAGATMIIPSIFAIVEWTAPLTFPFAFTLTLTLVALLLPLSSLWAAKVMRDDAAEFNSNRLWGGHPDRDNNQSSISGKTWKSESTRDTNPRGEPRERRPSTHPLTSQSEMADSSINTTPQRDSTEVDLEKIGVRVKKSYSVHSGRDS